MLQFIAISEGLYVAKMAFRHGTSVPEFTNTQPIDWGGYNDESGEDADSEN